jgi:hypothetical protein
MEYVAENVITTSIMMNPNLNFSMNRMLRYTKDCHELNMCYMVIYICVEMQIKQGSERPIQNVPSMVSPNINYGPSKM